MTGKQNRDLSAKEQTKRTTTPWRKRAEDFGCRGSFGLDFVFAAISICACVSLALFCIFSLANSAQNSAQNFELERKAIAIADWLAKHCPQEHGLAFCVKPYSEVLRASHATSADAVRVFAQKWADGLSVFFGLEDGEFMEISVQNIGGNNDFFEKIGNGVDGVDGQNACVERVMILLEESEADDLNGFYALGMPNAGGGFDEVQLKVCVSHG